MQTHDRLSMNITEEARRIEGDISMAKLPLIPAMTSDAERQCYYRLAQEAAQNGEVIEFGAWLGASTAYIAAGYRDGGGQGAVQVYDKFQSKPGHVRKVREFYDKKGLDLAGIPIGDAFDHFRHNLGDLMHYVEAHPCQIETIKWGDAPIALIINDAPKRVPAISAVLTNFRKGIREGTVMAWQDFCHFPSYEIPACLYLLRDHFESVEAIVPGSTLVFRVKAPWDAADVSAKALSLDQWTPGTVEDAWNYWTSNFVPAPKVPLFMCGRAMFLCDIGYPDEAVEALDQVYSGDYEAIIPKWKYLHRERPDFRKRYAPLFSYLAGKGVL